MHPTTGLLIDLASASFMFETRLSSFACSKRSIWWSSALKILISRCASMASFATRVMSPIEFWMRLL